MFETPQTCFGSIDGNLLLQFSYSIQFQIKSLQLSQEEAISCTPLQNEGLWDG